jgi:hypothetical protein
VRGHGSRGSEGPADVRPSPVAVETALASDPPCATERGNQAELPSFGQLAGERLGRVRAAPERSIEIARHVCDRLSVRSRNRLGDELRQVAIEAR